MGRGVDGMQTIQRTFAARAKAVAAALMRRGSGRVILRAGVEVLANGVEARSAQTHAITSRFPLFRPSDERRNRPKKKRSDERKKYAERALEQR